MRLKLGRPDIDHYADRFDVPAADGGLARHLPRRRDAAVRRRRVGRDVRRVLLPAVAARRSGCGRSRRTSTASTPGCTHRLRRRPPTLGAVVPVHTHFDHAMDSAVVAERTGAELVGGESTANVGRGGGLPEDRIRVVGDGEQATYGDFTLTFVVSEHCPPDRFPGTIDAPVVPPVKAGAYRCGEAWSVLVDARQRAHRAGAGQRRVREGRARRPQRGRRLPRRRPARHPGRRLHPRRTGRRP